jgi:hypothetical protein
MSGGCRCGSLRISGQELPPTAHPNIPGSERERLLELASCFSILTGGISVSSAASLVPKVHSPFCADLTCGACLQTFRFFSAQGIVFGGLLRIAPRSIPASFSGVARANWPHPINSFPPFLRRAIYVRLEPAAPDRHFIDDPDFDIMFGRALEPVVGRYRRPSVGGRLSETYPPS